MEGLTWPPPAQPAPLCHSQCSPSLGSRPGAVRSHDPRQLVALMRRTQTSLCRETTRVGLGLGTAVPNFSCFYVDLGGQVGRMQDGQGFGGHHRD